MKKLRVASFLPIFYLLSLTIGAQNMPTGAWRTHVSYHDGRLLTQSVDAVFCATQYGLFFVVDDQPSTIEPTQGISGVGVTALQFDDIKQQLLLGYEDGTIDLVYQDRVDAITTLKDSDFSSSKKINEFAKVSDEIYAATDLGVALLDLNASEVRDVFRDIGPSGNPIRAYDLIAKGDSICALTSSGVLLGHPDDNLLDFNNWGHFGGSITQHFTQLEVIAGELVALGLDQLYARTFTEWDTLFTFPEPVNDIVVNLSSIYALSDSRIYQVRGDSAHIVHEGLFRFGRQMEFDGNTIWVADGKEGLVKIEANATSSIRPKGVLEDRISRLKRVGDDVWAFHAANVENWSGESDSLGYSVYSDGYWENYSIDGVYDITSAESFRGGVYLTSLSAGLYDLTQQKVVSGTENQTLTDMATLSEDLWVTSYDDNESIIILHEDQSISTLRSGTVGTRFPLNLEVSIGNVAWLQRGSNEGRGLIAYEPLTSDIRLINSADGLPSTTINDFLIDQADEAWIGTPMGPVFFPDATFVFDEQSAFQPFFDGGALFEEEAVNAMAVDGGNRRWFGTDRGLWLFDEQLREVVHHFTSDNSILPSDRVIDLLFNGATGELVVLTDRGMMSYQTDSSDPVEATLDVTVYPNPVRSNHDVVTIQGIAGNASIKITNIEGRIVDQFESNGSTASWNLLSHNGAKVANGVYLIYIADALGEETFVGKVAVLR